MQEESKEGEETLFSAFYSLEVGLAGPERLPHWEIKAVSLPGYQLSFFTEACHLRVWVQFLLALPRRATRLGAVGHPTLVAAELPVVQLLEEVRVVSPVILRVLSIVALHGRSFLSKTFVPRESKISHKES